MKAKDGRILARKNELNILRALHRFGWLRSRDLAVLIWQVWRSQPPKSGPSLAPRVPTHSGLRMAQRTLRRMRDRRLVLTAQAPDGSVIYSISESGARLLQRLGVAARSGKDMVRRYSGQHYLHRCISNEIAIGGIVEGYRVASEREISQGLWIGGQAGIHGKRPDALLRDGRKVYWVEVERSRRKSADYQKLLAWLQRLWSDKANIWQPATLADGVELAQVVFVCTPAFASRLSEDLKRLGWSPELIAFRVRAETALYSFQAIAFF